MTKGLLRVLLWIQLLLIPAALASMDQDSGRSRGAGDCDARCAFLEGEGKYRCLRTCNSARKRNAPVGDNQVKKKIRECEAACEQYKGIDNITCRRVCLDNKRYIPPQKKEQPPQEDISPCESRCSVLTGPARENCISRCEKKSRFKPRDGAGK